jgi:hypothetical protein
MAIKTCRDEFLEGLERRKQHPLPHGYYKLRECHDRLVGTVEELQRIEELVSGRGDKWSLQHCVSEDKHLWIKNVPRSVAWRLGYEALPGLRALTGSGVPKGDVESLYPTLLAEAEDLAERLETHRRCIAKNIRLEYEGMKMGLPLLKPLVAEAICIAERAMSLHRQPVQGEQCECRPVASLSPP